MADAAVLLHALTTRGWEHTIVIEAFASEEPQLEYSSMDGEMPELEENIEIDLDAEVRADSESDKGVDTYEAFL